MPFPVVLSFPVFLGLASLSTAAAQEPIPTPAPASPAPLQDGNEAQARLLFENGERLYDEGRYEQAILAFQEAYELSRRHALLYNMANAYERLGKLEQAVDALNTFRIHASAEQQGVLLARVQAIEQRIAEQREETAEAIEAIGIVPRVAPVVTPPRRSPAPWVLTSVGTVLAVGGGAVAGGTWFMSRQQRDPAQWAATRPLNNIGFGSAMAGITLGFSGIVWGVSRRP